MSDETLSDYSLADSPEVVGFFSYSREDDEDSNDGLSALREAIQRELRGQLGRSRQQLRLWQDKEAIAPGRLWEAEIKIAVEQSVFFIPIVTPTVLKSRYCQTEFTAFLEREHALERNDLVFPILYIRVPELESEARWRNHPVLSVIGRRQWVDWRELRVRPVNDVSVRQAIVKFCTRVVEALQAPTTSPEELERHRQEADAARRREPEQRREEARRAEQRQREAEAEVQAAERHRQKEAELQQHTHAERRRVKAETSFRYGDCVSSPMMGEGMVVGTNQRSGLVLVSFDSDHIQRRVEPGELTAIPKQQAAASRRAPAAVTAASDDGLGARSFRYGDRVSSPMMGEGMVVGTDQRSGLVLVSFDSDHIQRRVEPGELTAIPKP